MTEVSDEDQDEVLRGLESLGKAIDDLKTKHEETVDLAKRLAKALDSIPNHEHGDLIMECLGKGWI